MEKVFLAALGGGLAVGAKDAYFEWKAREQARQHRRFSDKALKGFERSVIGGLILLTTWIVYFCAWFVLGSHGYMLPQPF